MVQILKLTGAPRLSDSNSEIRMTRRERMTNNRMTTDFDIDSSSFGLLGFFRHSSFVLRHLSQFFSGITNWNFFGVGDLGVPP